MVANAPVLAASASSAWSPQQSPSILTTDRDKHFKEEGEMAEQIAILRTVWWLTMDWHDDYNSDYMVVKILQEQLKAHPNRYVAVALGIESGNVLVGGIVVFSTCSTNSHDF